MKKAVFEDKSTINRISFSSKLRLYRKKPLSLILFLLVCISAVLTLLVFASLVGYTLIKGIPNLSPELFALEYTTENVSMTPAIINTLSVTLLSLLIATPLGIFSAIYLVEYARRGNKLVSVIRVTAETLSGIPSIVYGLFGYLLFNISLGWGYSLISGILTLSIMILPLVMRTAEEALKSVPDSYREASFGLGAGRLRTVFRIVLPAAVPGILSGVILSVGRIIGETAALLYTAGTVSGIATGVMKSGRTLSVHLYSLLNEGLYTNQAYATAVVILITVVLINALSSFIAKKIGGKNG